MLTQLPQAFSLHGRLRMHWLHFRIAHRLSLLLKSPQNFVAYKREQLEHRVPTILTISMDSSLELLPLMGKSRKSCQDTDRRGFYMGAFISLPTTSCKPVGGCMYDKLWRQIYWPHMENDIYRKVNNCQSWGCNRAMKNQTRHLKHFRASGPLPAHGDHIRLVLQPYVSSNNIKNKQSTYDVHGMEH